MYCIYCGMKLDRPGEKCSRCATTRKESQSALAPPGNNRPSKSKRWWYVALAVVLWLIGSSTHQIPETSTQKQSSNDGNIVIQPTVAYSGTEFTITNNDNFDWTEVNMTVNPHGFNGGFHLFLSRVAAGESYTVGAMQFAESDGRRFNHFADKLLTMTISCKTSQGNALWLGGSSQ